jgi:pimeloyl-ACP methyl ester carboxylesterase
LTRTHLVAGLLTLSLAACATTRSPSAALANRVCWPSLQTLLFLQRWSAAPGPDDAPTTSLAIPNPEGAPYAADVYRAEGTMTGTMLIVSGAAETGKADQRLRHLARTFARSGVTVLVPEIPMLKALQVRPEIVPAIRRAFTFLIRQPDLAPDGRAAIFAISFSVGPALMAALRPDVGPHLDLLFGLGGYHGIEPLLTFLTTGWFQDEHGTWRFHEPNRYGQWVYVLSNLDTVSDGDDRTRLDVMARKRLADAQADITAEAGQLGPEGRALYDLISNDDRRRVPELIARLPAAARERLRQLDVARLDLRQLTAPVILLHGRQDDIVPYTGSLDLHGAMAPGRSRLFIVNDMAHIDPQDAGALVCAVEALFRGLKQARNGDRQRRGPVAPWLAISAD